MSLWFVVSQIWEASCLEFRRYWDAGIPREKLPKSSGLIAKYVASDEGMEEVSGWSTSVHMTDIRGVETLVYVEQLVLHHFLWPVHIRWWNGSFDRSFGV